MTPEQAANTIRENVVHIARGCLSGRSHDPTFYEREIAAALKVLEDAANEAREELRENDRLVESAWRQRDDETEKAKQAEARAAEVEARYASQYQALRDAEARAETLTQDLEEAHVLVVTASVAFGSPVCDEAPQELWDKAHVRGWVVTEQDFTGDYQTRMTGEGERALAAALAAPATPTGADDAAA